MKTLKHGDTDGYVTFTLRIGDGLADLTDRTIELVLNSQHLGIRREIATAVVSEPATDGEVTWQPSDADFEVLLPSTYSVEIVAESTTGAQRTFPTVGYDSLKIEPRL